jgi:hypothetical protein
MVPATDDPIRRESTSRSVPGFMFARMLMVSNRSSTGFQKKKRFEMLCRFSDRA